MILFTFQNWRLDDIIHTSNMSCDALTTRRFVAMSRRVVCFPNIRGHTHMHTHHHRSRFLKMSFNVEIHTSTNFRFFFVYNLSVELHVPYISQHSGYL